MKDQSVRKRLWKPLEHLMRSVSVPARDYLHNRHVQTDGKIVLVRHVQGLASYYKAFLQWTAENLPEVHSRLELRLLPCRISDWSRYSLVVPWITENVLYELATGRNQFRQLVEDADAHGVPVINRPEPLLRATKYEAPRRMAELGVRTPKVSRITDADSFRRDLSGLRPPLLVREELGHNTQNPISYVATVEDARRIPLESYSKPIAVEFIDVRSRRDGLVRKYRYMAAGNHGFALTLQVSQHWEVRGSVRIMNEQTRREEIAFQDRPDPHHELWQHVRRGLGLDFLAFDYSLDHEGRPVVWEINTLPGLSLRSWSNLEHLVPPVERMMAATIKMYLQRGGLDVPQRVDELMRLRPRDTHDAFRNHSQATASTASAMTMRREAA